MSATRKHVERFVDGSCYTPSYGPGENTKAETRDYANDQNQTDASLDRAGCFRLERRIVFQQHLHKAVDDLALSDVLLRQDLMGNACSFLLVPLFLLVECIARHMPAKKS